MDNNIIRAKIILEGLVKVPPLMFKQALNATVYFFLKELDDNIDTWNLPEHTSNMMKYEISRARSRHKVYKPKHDFKVSTKGDLVMLSIPFDRYKLPKDYKINYDGEVHIVMDFAHKFVSKGTNANWSASKKTIGINMNPEGVPQLRRATKQRDFIFQLNYVIQHYKNGLEHEMAHMIGDLFIKQKDPKSQAWKKDYDDKDDAYFTSSVEFESMIITAVRSFIQEIETLQHIFVNDEDPEAAHRIFKRRFNVKEMSEIYVGLRKSKGLTGIQVFPFFKSLKRTAPARWKIAYKKFFKELTLYIQKFK